MIILEMCEDSLQENYPVGLVAPPGDGATRSGSSGFSLLRYDSEVCGERFGVLESVYSDHHRHDVCQGYQSEFGYGDEQYEHLIVGMSTLLIQY